MYEFDIDSETNLQEPSIAASNRIGKGQVIGALPEKLGLSMMLTGGRTVAPVYGSTRRLKGRLLVRHF